MVAESILSLGNNKLLKNAKIEQINFFNEIGRLKVINKGDILYREGDFSDAIYLVLEGEINLLKKNKNGTTHSISFSNNDFFGTKEVFTNITRCTSTLSLTDSYLIEIRKDEIQYLIEHDDNIAFNIQKGNNEFKFDYKIIDLEEQNSEYQKMENKSSEMIIENIFSQKEMDKITNYIHEPELSIFNSFEKFDNDNLSNNKYLNFHETSDNNFRSNINYYNFDKKIHENNMITDTISTENNYMTADQFEMVIKALQLVNSNVKKDDVLKNIVDVAINLTNADRGTLYLVEGDEIWSKVLVGDELEEIRMKVGDGLAGWVAQSGEILNIKDVNEDTRFDSSFDEASGYTTKNMLVYPIKNKNNETIGVIQLLNSINGEFTTLEEAFLNAISLNVAVALENTSLVEKLITTEREMSIGKMGNFLAHDLKKPILTSLRYAEHLSKKDLSFDVKQVINLLVDQLKQVSDKLVTASDFTEGTILLRRKPVVVSDMLQEFSINAHNLIKESNCKIEHEINDDATVNIDKKEFYQCYYNIIKNACEALPDGGNILISTIKQDDIIEIYFIDRGVGIDKSDLKFVFDPLWTKNKNNNSGLGLSISKKIVEDHNGAISIKSEKDLGTTVIISLPIH